MIIHLRYQIRKISKEIVIILVSYCNLANLHPFVCFGKILYPSGQKLNKVWCWSLFIGILLEIPYLVRFSGGSRISRRGGGVDSRGGYFLKILYVKTKDSGPLVGGVRRACPLDPPMRLNLNLKIFEMRGFSTEMRERPLSVMVIVS